MIKGPQSVEKQEFVYQNVSRASGICAQIWKKPLHYYDICCSCPPSCASKIMKINPYNGIRIVGHCIDIKHAHVEATKAIAPFGWEVLEGDANILIQNGAFSQNPKGLQYVLIDPDGMEIDYKTVCHFGKWRHCDMNIFIPNGARRVIGYANSHRDSNDGWVKKATRWFPGWENLPKDICADDLVTAYAKSLEGYKPYWMILKPKPLLFRLLVMSSNPRGLIEMKEAWENVLNKRYQTTLEEII